MGATAMSTIPKKIHLVWITSKHNPKELINNKGLAFDDVFPSWERCVTLSKTPFSSNQMNINEFKACLFRLNSQHINAGDLNYIHNINKISEKFDDWSITLWTNDRSLIPYTVSTLNERGIEVNELDRVIRDSTLLSSEAKEYVRNFKFQHDAGDIIDVLKYMVVEKYGGLSIDPNFEAINKIPEEFLSKCSSIHHTQENFFFASKAGGEILRQIIAKFTIDLAKSCDDTSAYFTRYGGVLNNNYKEYCHAFSAGPSRSVIMAAHEELERVVIGRDVSELSWEV